MSCISHLPRAHGRRSDCLIGLREDSKSEMAAQKVALKCRADFQRFSRIWTPTAQDWVAASADIGLSRK
jgi:hypothetical protein